METDANSLFINAAQFNSSEKSIATWNSSIQSCKTNVAEFSLKLVGLSVDIIDVSNNIYDLSSITYDFSSGVSKLSSGISKLSSRFSNVITDFAHMSADANVLSSNVTGLSSDFDKLTNKMGNLSIDSSALLKTDSALSKMSSSAELMNDKLGDTKSNAEKAGSGFGKFLKSALSFDNVKKGMDMVDQYINSSNKLSKINDGSQDQLGLQDKINAAANRSTGSYSNIANAVSDIGSLGTFKKDNDSAIGFAELTQKSLKLDGSDQSLSDVTQSMSDGVIQGDELSSIAKPNSTIDKALTSYTGKSSTQLQDMANQGLITADLLKNAMFAASNDINTEFEKQPKTFADAWTKITNSATNALNPIMQQVSNILNSSAVQAGINVIINALGLISQAIGDLVGFITDNWSSILPILIAIGAYLVYIGATALIAEMAAIVPILIIIGIIAGVIYALKAMGISFEDVFGFIGGVVGGAIAVIWNLFLALFEFILGIINNLVNPFINFANFFGNLFTNPVSSIIYLFQSMADNVLGIIESVASAIDKLLGTKLAVSVSGLRSDLKNMADTAVKKYAPDENYTKYFKNSTLSTQDLGLNRMDVSNTIDNGTKTGKDIYRNIDNIMGKLGKSDKGSNYYSQFINSKNSPSSESNLMNKKGKGSNGSADYSQFMNSQNSPGTAANPMSVKGTGSNGSVNVDMKNEDLGYLRDMAERDYIANVATNTLAPNISVSFGDVHENADVNQLYGRIQKILKEQIATAPEGVY